MVYSPLYDITTYLRDHEMYFDTIRFSTSPSAEATLTVLFGPGIRDTAAGSWRERWKNWRGRGAPDLQAACHEIYPPFVRCHEEDDYEQNLATLLAEMCGRPYVPTFEAADVLKLPEHLGHLYFLANRAH